MFDQTFFSGPFQDILNEWAEHRELPTVAVTIVTVQGERMNVTGLRSVQDAGAVFFTEDDEMHFVPYPMIAKVEVRRLTGKRIGFDAPARSEDT